MIIGYWINEYFDYRIVKTANLPADRNYIVGYGNYMCFIKIIRLSTYFSRSHPHGMICIGMTMSFFSYVSYPFFGSKR